MSQRTALLTDVLHFVGLSSAKALQQMGVAVMCHDASFASSDEARAQFEAENPGLKAASEQEPEALAGEALETWGRIDILVNNDAYPAHRMPLDQTDMALVRETMEALFMRPYALTGAAIPAMKRQGAGKIVFITSAAPIGGIANYAPYVAARGAINATVRSLALEFARHDIQVNAVAPNFVASPDYFPPALMNDPDKGPKVLKNIPLGRLGTQEEAAALVAFLAGPRSGFLTGQVIPFAGGWA